MLKKITDYIKVVTCRCWENGAGVSRDESKNFLYIIFYIERGKVAELIGLEGSGDKIHL